MASPHDLLRKFLADDRAAGIPWTNEDFRQRVELVGRLFHNPGFAEPIISMTSAWRDAYELKPGPLAQFGPSIANKEHREHVGSLTLA